ncbi:MAG: nucleotide sugar dehydrogenase [Planctomycetaceae bacterium]|nr:nucleotide sugar dehydrogenase [Planctomycetaceae bacterium]
MTVSDFSPLKISIIGGGGHVGLPLGLFLCDHGHSVTIVDTDQERLDQIGRGEMPFLEEGAEELLPKCLASGRFVLRSDQDAISDAELIIMTIGTPVDEYLDPQVRAFDEAVQDVLEHTSVGQLLMIRSTVFPGVTDRLGRQVAEEGHDLDVCYCPERIAQGRALQELTRLPQLVSGCSDRAQERAADFFRDLGAQVIELSPLEAELGKLFTNCYRYINFAISNQFYMLAEHYGVDFQRIYEAITADYPRLNGFSNSGLTGGPCLLKDTMQLASFNHNLLTLGQHAMMVNEGLPCFIIEQLKKEHDLKTKTVGVLGMAFKGNCDDGRSSLSYKLKKILSLECRRVLCTDPYIDDDDNTTLQSVLEEADILILGACHQEYRDLKPRQSVVDVFGFMSRD